MSETVKLIIEIPEETYLEIKDGFIIVRNAVASAQAIKNGIPLEEIRAEIKNKYYAEEEPTTYQMGTNLGLRLAVEILDSIDKGDSE